MKRTLPVMMIVALVWLFSRPTGDAAAQKQPTERPAAQPSKSPALLIAPFDKATALTKQQEWARYLGKNSHIEKNSIGIEMVLIPPGEYHRGSSDAEIEKLLIDTDFTRENLAQHLPRHRVRISQPFWLGRTEVTQKEWKAVMGTEPWKGSPLVKKGDDYPATYVSWDNAQEFLKKLNVKEGTKKYRLPTEAEWEYACRAGTTTLWSFGEDESDFDEYGWYGGLGNWGNIKNEQYAHRVGQKRSNGFGLSDMHGNVWEWCSDRYNANEYRRYASETAVDPAGPDNKQSERVVRGGTWLYTPKLASSAFRYRFAPDVRNFVIGFRLLRIE